MSKKIIPKRNYDDDSESEADQPKVNNHKKKPNSDSDDDLPKSNNIKKGKPIANNAESESDDPMATINKKKESNATNNKDLSDTEMPASINKSLLSIKPKVNNMSDSEDEPEIKQKDNLKKDLKDLTVLVKTEAKKKQKQPPESDNEMNDSTPMIKKSSAISDDDDIPIPTTKKSTAAMSDEDEKQNEKKKEKEKEKKPQIKPNIPVIKKSAVISDDDEKEKEKAKKPQTKPKPMSDDDDIPVTKKSTAMSDDEKENKKGKKKPQTKPINKITKKKTKSKKESDDESDSSENESINTDSESSSNLKSGSSSSDDNSSSSSDEETTITKNKEKNKKLQGKRKLTQPKVKIIKQSKPKIEQLKFIYDSIFYTEPECLKNTVRFKHVCDIIGVEPTQITNLKRTTKVNNQKVKAGKSAKLASYDAFHPAKNDSLHVDKNTETIISFQGTEWYGKIVTWGVQKPEIRIKDFKSLQNEDVLKQFSLENVSFVRTEKQYKMVIDEPAITYTNWSEAPKLETWNIDKLDEKKKFADPTEVFHWTIYVYPSRTAGYSRMYAFGLSSCKMLVKNTDFKLEISNKNSKGKTQEPLVDLNIMCKSHIGRLFGLGVLRNRFTKEFGELAGTPVFPDYYISSPTIENNFFTKPVDKNHEERKAFNQIINALIKATYPNQESSIERMEKLLIKAVGKDIYNKHLELYLEQKEPEKKKVKNNNVKSVVIKKQSKVNNKATNDDDDNSDLEMTVVPNLGLKTIAGKEFIEAYGIFFKSRNLLKDKEKYQITNENKKVILEQLENCGVAEALYKVAKDNPNGELAKAFQPLIKLTTYKEWLSQLPDEIMCQIQMFLTLLLLQKDNRIQISKL